ncbi:hypothetical protein MIND_00997000 [Mycena indigotica]|uniref:F-box domain-containing protein n=1 Tax=Mycena indigotica TaxID=2126181 RepID=A0A8H6S839_9AGAR|nr:uncharacterized protein MIND_00997000 [Mycena indigotica]KAF7294604.1 hypothetical protein MIND_00997000 [Mycena indigotica]
MSSLPVELLIEIFTHSLPETPSNPSIHDSPLLLTRVCRLWHDVALATPLLWTSFSVNFALYEDTLPFQIAKLWLSRSQNLPLSIYVDDSLDGDDDPEPQRWAFYEELCRHAHRWQNAALNLPFTILWRLPIQQPLGMLESLKMGRDDSGQSVPNRKVSTFMTAPRLKSVEIWLDNDEAMNIQGIGLPWAQLTVFRGRLFTNDECLFVLLQAPQLVECDFNDIVDGYVPDANVVTPFLRVLQLDEASGHSCACILSFLTAPNLNKFICGARKQDDTDDNSLWPLREFLSRSCSSLTQLHISMNQSTREWDKLMLCLPFMSLLEHLEIFWFHEDFDLTPLSDALLPRLRTLVFNSHTVPGNVTVMNLLSLLLVRTSEEWVVTNGVCLGRFKFTWPFIFVDLHPDEDPEIQSRVRLLRKRGVHIHMGGMEWGFHFFDC